MTALELFNVLFNAGLVVMIVTLVLSLGMGFTLAQVLAPLRRVGVIVAAVVVNAVLVPAVAWGTSSLFAVSSEQRAAIVLVSAAAAGPAGLKACQFAKRADMALAVSLVVILMLVNIVAAPLWAQAVVTGASVSTWMIIKDLLLLVLVPLVIGLVIKARYAEHAASWGPALERASNIALVIAIAAGFAVNWHDLVALVGSRVIVVSTVVAVAGAALGWVAAYRRRDMAIASSMVSAMRFTPIGLVVIMTQLDGNGAYLAPALVFALVDTIVPFVLGLEIGRATTARTATHTEPARAVASN
jgi:BASS family bile acid:Na+ symporter